MSEFEVASLDYRTATLAARHTANWIAATGIFVSVLQTGIVAWGIREMIRANRELGQRADAQALLDERRLDERRRADEQRHAENMRRLDALLEEQAAQRRASDAQTRALLESLERVSPKPPTSS